MICDIHQIISA